MKVCYFHLVSNLIQLKINGPPWLSGHPDTQNSTALNLVSSVLKPSREQHGRRQPQAKALSLLGTGIDLSPTMEHGSLWHSRHNLPQRCAILLNLVGGKRGRSQEKWR